MKTIALIIIQQMATDSASMCSGLTANQKTLTFIAMLIVLLVLMYLIQREIKQQQPTDEFNAGVRTIKNNQNNNRRTSK